MEPKIMRLRPGVVMSHTGLELALFKHVEAEVEGGGYLPPLVLVYEGQQHAAKDALISLKGEYPSLAGRIEVATAAFLERDDWMMVGRRAIIISEV